MPSSSPRVERARPLLGTTVAIAAEASDAAGAHRAIEAAFAAVGRVHALMSFQDPESELSALNRTAWREPVCADPLTFAVLAAALGLAEASGGAFDPTVGGALVACGALPDHGRTPPACPHAHWRDVALDRPRLAIRFARPLRLDLSGIAKGFAVDLALAALRRGGAAAGLVNAGGDLACFGAPERVVLDTGEAQPGGLPILTLQDGACASSGALAGPTMARHLFGGQAPPPRFACVAAPRCLWADGLTKVALAGRPCADAVLARYGATAFVAEADGGWRTLGATA